MSDRGEMLPLTAAEIADLLAKAEKATPRPWSYPEPENRNSDNELLRESYLSGPRVLPLPDTYAFEPADADYLVAAANLAPRLAAEVGRLRREILAAGKSDFDWSVLERLDKLEEAEAEVQRIAAALRAAREEGAREEREACARLATERQQRHEYCPQGCCCADGYHVAAAIRGRGDCTSLPAR
jgi:hypothetical protein